MEMKRKKFILFATGLLTASLLSQSCDDDSDTYCDMMCPTALVTVRPSAASGFTLQLDNKTTLYPTNMKQSPFGDKEVRALVNYSLETRTNGSVNNVHINWIDSIRTKQPVATAGADNDKRYGNDPIEIVRDWVTVAEDGYLTLRIRTRWGAGRKMHHVNLLTGGNPDNPYELELRHDAHGDVDGRMGDALIAFNLNHLPKGGNGDVRIILSWMSFSGKKSAEFSLQLHDNTAKDYAESMPLNKSVE